MTYTVTWKVTRNESAPCPDYVPDPYTGAYPSTHCLVYHFKTVTEEKARVFETEAEANEFIRYAPDYYSEMKLLRHEEVYGAGTGNRGTK